MRAVPRPARRVVTVTATSLALALGGPALGAPVRGTTAAPALRTADRPERPAGAGSLAAPGLLPGRDRLGLRDRRALTRAVAAGRRSVTVLVATRPDRARSVSEAVRALGGTVGYRSAPLGYVRAALPTRAVERAAKLQGVAAVDLDARFRLAGTPLADTPPADSSPAGGPARAPGPDTPAHNPYLPTREIGAPQFVRRHPRWDGRGVTIGVLDSGVDLDHPALRTTSTGRRKIVDWVTSTDPVADGDGTWRPMLQEVTGPGFRYADREWSAPAGALLINRFSESVTAGSEVGGDVNRDGDTTDDWGVLYRADDAAVWVDTDDDGDFTDEVLRRPYRRSGQVGHFGTDDPATPLRERMPFVVETRRDVDLSPAGLEGRRADFVNIGIPSDSHATHLAGIAAGRHLFGGAMSGAAPGARIVSSRACAFGGGCSATALTEGMIDLVVHRGVDVVATSIGGQLAVNDGSSAQSMLYDRLVAEHGVQIFASAGNAGPGIGTVGDPGVATDVVSVAASVSRATWLANYGARVPAPHTVFPFSSRGPRADGGLEPDLAAPGSAISTTPAWLPGGPVPEAGYALPPGYALFSGTSVAAPMAAGGAALLLSAGRHAGVPVRPASLRRSMADAAWFDRRIPSFAQGLGQVRVGPSWRLLRRVASTTPGRYDVSAPVCSPLSASLRHPGRGEGVYNRCPAGAGGQAPGRPRPYRIQVTRQSGAAGARVHRLRWLGNDGTFSARSRVALPLGRPVTVTVRARARSGAHSAILLVDDPSTPGVDRAVSVVVVAPTALRARGHHSWRVGDRVRRAQGVRYFLTVPEGARALRVRLSGVADGDQVRFLAFTPAGVGVESNSSLRCYTGFSDVAACSPTSRTYADPPPGVWELTVDARRTTAHRANRFRLSAAVRGVRMAPQVTDVAAARLGRATRLSWSVRNRFAPVTVRAAGAELGSAVTARPSIGAEETDTSTVDVPAGASRLDVAIGGPSDSGADLDLTLLRDGQVVAQSADGDSEESVSLEDPEPGTYQVQVLAYDVPAGSTDYDYRDVYYTGRLGRTSTDAAPLSLRSRGTARLTGSVTPRGLPGPGRSLVGEVTLADPEGTVVGRADVVLPAVSR